MFSKRKKQLNGNATIFTPSTATNLTGNVNRPTVNTTHLMPPPPPPPPPMETVSVNAKRGVYEIHVSRFCTDRTENNIVQHIIDNTGLTSSQFSVIKLMPAKQRNYVSFKIVMLEQGVYEKLIDPDLWPGYTARDFMPEGRKYERKFNKFGRNSMMTHQNRNSNDMRRNVLMKNAYKFKPRANVNENRSRQQLSYESYVPTQQSETPRRPFTPRQDVINGYQQRQCQQSWNRPRTPYQNQRQFDQPIQQQSNGPPFQTGAQVTYGMQPQGQNQFQPRTRN